MSSRWIELVAGGVRSGKSRYAQEAAERLSSSPLFVATATTEDASMADRILRHQAERGEQWRQVEEPLKLSEVIMLLGPDEVVVVDCLTLWLSNWLCRGDSSGWENERTEFLLALTETRATVFLVTNEVGMGVVPLGELSREFVDQCGWLHQDIARMADRVTIMHFGIPTVIR